MWRLREYPRDILRLSKNSQRRDELAAQNDSGLEVPAAFLQERKGHSSGRKDFSKGLEGRQPSG